jgi:hypothetical protein
MTPSEEKELLLRVVSQVARSLMDTGGQMHFGAVLGSKRDVQVLIPKSMKENVTQDELHVYWERELHAAVVAGDCKAVSSCTFVNVPGRDGKLTTALLIHMEHEETGAEDILLPYRCNEDKSIVFGESTREPGTLRTLGNR